MLGRSVYLSLNLKECDMKAIAEFSLIMRSSLTTLREKFENPERMLYPVSYTHLTLPTIYSV